MSGLRAIDELADRLEDLDLTCMEGCVGPNLCDGTCVRSALAESRLARYPHDDDLCRQDSVDAACFKDLCRALASTDVPEGMGASEAVHWLSARESAARAEVLAKVEALADDFDTNIDWSNGRNNYGDNAAWESAARQIRALVADLGGTDD